jgi:hypothetical protein
LRGKRAIRRERAGARAPVRRSRKAAILELDAMARKLVMLRAGACEFELEKMDGSGFSTAWRGRCERCGAEGWLEWAHFIGRRNYHVRWDEENAFGFCRDCHSGFCHSASRDDANEDEARPFRDWVEAFLGEARFGALRLRAAATDRVDFETVKLRLELQTHARLNGRELE